MTFFMVQDQWCGAGAVRRIPGELDIGLVDENHDVGRNVLDELLQVFEGRDDPRRIAWRRDDDDSRVFGDGRLHRVEVLVKVAGYPNQSGLCAILPRRANHPAVPWRRLDHLAAVAQVGRRDGEEHFRRSTAKGNPWRRSVVVIRGKDDRKSVPFRDHCVQSPVPVVPVEPVDLLHDCVDGAGRRSDRHLIAAQANQSLGHAPTPDGTSPGSRHHLGHGFVTAQGNRACADREPFEKLPPRKPGSRQVHRLNHIRHIAILFDQLLTSLISCLPVPS